MGKLLDFASSVGSDLNLFQEIAENFSNIRLNKEGNPIFIGILHQPFEEYARSLGRTVEEEWQKIQGRFEDIPFTINPEETVHLISHAINHKSKDNNFSILSEKISKIINNGKNNKTLFEALSNCNPEIWKNKNDLIDALRGSLCNGPKVWWWSKYIPSLL